MCLLCHLLVSRLNLSSSLLLGLGWKCVSFPNRMDMEIEEMRISMMKVSQSRHTEVKKIIKNRVNLIFQVCINKANGKL
jgi:hypothetical protein